MNISTYFPDSGEFHSASKQIYKIGQQREDMVIFMACATEFVEGGTNLEEFINKILKNYDISYKNNH